MSSMDLSFEVGEDGKRVGLTIREYNVVIEGALGLRCVEGGVVISRREKKEKKNGRKNHSNKKGARDERNPAESKLP